ncbi:MAG: hypothetical protein Q9220_007375 [cf. Caloplaca sp. 1 TL-2023]
MPPARRGRPPGSTPHRTSSDPRAAQSTLAFGRSNKITKPSVPPSSSRKISKPSKSKDEEVAVIQTGSDKEESVDVRATSPKSGSDDVVVAAIAPTEVKEEVASLKEGREKAMAIRQAHKTEEAVALRDENEEKAGKVSEAAVKRYWREKEMERKAPRVHQQTLSLHEKILRHFDLSSQYGPCVGIPRVRRWKRAQGLGLKPPIEVLAVLVREKESGEKGMDRAFMDGLLGGT